MSLSTTLPLHGVRILDLSRLLPGPYACRVLAELGADVIKVESPEGGDWTRFTPPLVGDPPVGALFIELNAGKKSVALDLKKPSHRQAFRKLVTTADVLVDGNRPGVLARLELAPESLMELNPRLIYAAISGFGLDGPDAQRAGHDIGYNARAGVLSLSGTEEAPAVSGFQAADMAASLFALVGIESALLQRARTGRGSVVDVSIVESAMSLGALAFGAMHGGQEPRRGHEILDGSRPCYAIYETLDGRHLAVGALEPKFWERFCSAIGLPELSMSGLDTGENGRVVRSQVANALRQKTRKEWMDIFGPADCCVEPVLSPREAEADRHLRAREIIDPVSGFVRGAARIGRDRVTLSRAPNLGAHTHEVLLEAGLTNDELSALAI